MSWIKKSNQNGGTFEFRIIKRTVNRDDLQSRRTALQADLSALSEVTNVDRTYESWKNNNIREQQHGIREQIRDIEQLLTLLRGL